MVQLRILMISLPTAMKHLQRKLISGSRPPGSPNRILVPVGAKSCSRFVPESDSIAQSLDAFPARTTASSDIVSKPSSRVVGPAQRSRASNSKREGIPPPESNTLGGISEEDDSLEKEAAMSSPMKGIELRSTTTVRFCHTTQN